MVEGFVFTQAMYLVYNSILTGNSEGGVIVGSGKISVQNSTLARNYGTGISVFSEGPIIINNSALTDHRHGAFNLLGKGIYVGLNISAFIYNSTFTSNSGGGIRVGSGSAFLYNSIMKGNTADYGGGMYVNSGKASIYNCTFTDNTANKGGGAYLYNSEVHFNGQTTLMSNNHGRVSGGAVEAIQSTVIFNSSVLLSNNTAIKNGGGIFLRESSLFASHFPVTMAHNTANKGGGIYAYQSTIDFNNPYIGDWSYVFANNVASNHGGGIYASASVIKISNSFVRVESNMADGNGGGFYLQENSRVYIHKHSPDDRNDLKVSLTVSDNKAAHLGGGIYVDDNTAGSGACSTTEMAADFLSECFIQTIKLYQFTSKNPNPVNTFMANNSANQAGNEIYGGLLDRCRVNPSAEVLDKKANINGLEYMRKTMELPVYKHSFSSDPLQVKLCDSYTSNVPAKKGQPFRLHVKALDQVGAPVNATIHGAVVTKSGIGRLKEGQVEQTVGGECTELEYNVFSADNSAKLELYAIGPCANFGISKLILIQNFRDCICPLGFHPSKSNIECNCLCDSKLHATECFAKEETFQPDSMLWVGTASIMDFNHTEYLVHDCPFDYCVDHPVNISLNSSQQIDRQCAYNRSGVLCGECKEGLSLMLATSKCKECSNTYLLLLIPFAVAGIALIVFILFLNITIATGNIYGMIFYANVLAANKAIFLPFKAPNVLTVFVSWINLDLGIETCLYDGMSSQAKVLLQLVFPAYLFLLMFLVIILSNFVDSFVKLLSNRNPVAALCTLLILSYSKLLRLIIATLQFTYLDCPDSSHRMVWLYNGNVQYFSPSHIPRFVAAAVILTACVLFTTLLFFGQWFPRCSKWKVLKWTKNTKYIGFMDAFHAPFTPKHRYWPGLLLFTVIAHNIAASMAPNTSVPVLSAGSVAGGLIVYKSVMNCVYKSKLNNALETLFLLNIIIFSLGTYHSKGKTTGQHALAYVSMAIAFILFVVIACYHFYKYVLRKTNVWNNQVQSLNPAQKINFHRNRNYQRVAEIDENDVVELPMIADTYSYGQGPREETNPDKYITPPIIRPATRPDQLREPDLDILAPITEEDYRQGPPIPQADSCPRPVVTSTVVEIEKNLGR